MKGRGRTSGEEKALIESGLHAQAADEAVTPVHRPRPPDHLGDEAAHVWRRMVASRPADWFPAETHDMLAHYCNHVVSVDRLQQLIDAIEQTAREVDVGAYIALLKERRGETNAIAMLATRMRLSQQSRYSARRGEAGGAPAAPTEGGDEAPKPWDD